jgi:hypothetical protein
LANPISRTDRVTPAVKVIGRKPDRKKEKAEVVPSFSQLLNKALAKENSKASPGIE